jgi:hypothetical protein
MTNLERIGLEAILENLIELEKGIKSYLKYNISDQERDQHFSVIIDALSKATKRLSSAVSSDA